MPNCFWLWTSEIRAEMMKCWIELTQFSLEYVFLPILKFAGLSKCIFNQSTNKFDQKKPIYQTNHNNYSRILTINLFACAVVMWILIYFAYFVCDCEKHVKINSKGNINFKLFNKNVDVYDTFIRAKLISVCMCACLRVCVAVEKFVIYIKII